MAAYVDQFVDFAQRGFEHYGIGGFGGDVAVMAEGYSDGSGLHGGRVVDAVAEEERGSPFGLFAYDGELFLGALAEENFGDADLGAEGTDLCFTVAGEEHDAIDAMLRGEVPDEGIAVGSG